MEVWNYFHVDSLGQLYINVIFALWILAVLAQTVKRLSTMRKTWVRALGWEDPLEKEMAIHSSTVAWKIPWTEEPGTLQSMGRKELGTTE